MQKFGFGSSTAFGDSSNVKTGNKGSYFWGKNLFKFDGSISDKQKLLKSVSNFVKILTGKNVPVKYCKEGEDSSFTDGKSITISSKIEPDNLDSTIGLALHESSHVAITNFQVIRDLMDKKNIDVKYHEYTKFIKDLHNWVEDRRIDYWAYNKAPGYKVYYEALYDRYFFSDQVSEVLLKHAAELRIETALNYQFFIINSLHPDVTMTELEGLTEIKEIIDINNNPQKWASTEETLYVALKIFDVIMKNVPSEELEKVNNANLPMTMDELADLIKKILEGQQEFLGGNTVKVELTEGEYKKIEALVKSQTFIENLQDDEGKYEVLTVNKVDESTIFSGLYSIFDARLGNGQDYLVTKGLALGTALGRKLKIRNDEKTLVTLNQKSGKIAKRKIFSAGYGNESIFYSNKEEKYNDLAVHISVDMSGSMDGRKWEQTLVALVAIAKATSMIRGIRTQISLHFGGNVTKRYGSWGGSEAIAINFYDSQIDTVAKLKLFKYVTPNGSTPEGLCFEGLSQKIMKNLINKHLLFINFSDGAPYFSGVSTKRALNITKKYIDKIEKEGASVLSYFISDSNQGSESEKEQFKYMYGKTAQFINVNSMMELTKTINKKFLELGK